MEEILELLNIAKDIGPKIRLCVVNIRLYPANSPVVKNSVNDTYSALTKHLEKQGNLTFGEKEMNLVVNNQSIPISKLKDQEKYLLESFVHLLREVHIRNLTFRVGLTYDELFDFLRGISEKKYKGSEKVKMLTKLFEEKNIDHIVINEWDYEAIAERDLVMERGKDYLEETGTKFEELIKSIEEVSRVFEKTADISLKEKIKMEIAEKITKLNPSLLLKFFEEKLSGDGEKVKQEIIAGFPPEYLKETILKMCKMYRTIKENTPPGSEREYQLLQLRDSINKLLSACKNKPILVDICKELLKEGFPELVPPWWQKPEIDEHSLAVSQARLLCQKDSLALLEDDVQGKLSGIFKVLDEIFRKDLMMELSKKICENLKSDTASVRLKSIELVKKLIPTLESLREKSIAKTIYNELIETIKEETDFKIYLECSQPIIRYLNSLIKLEEYEDAIGILKIFAKHRYEKEGGFSRRPQCASEVFRSIANSEMMHILIEDIKSGIPQRRNNATRIIAYLQDAAISPLIETIKNTEEFRTRKFLSQLIKYLGKDAVIRLLEELDMQLEPKEIIRLIQILDGLEEDELAAEHLKKVILHHNIKVRIEAVRTLGRLKTSKVGEVLILALQDMENYVRREVINILGDIRYEPAIDALINLIKPESIFKKQRIPEYIQEAVCRTLGRIGKIGTHKYLIKVAKPNGPISFTREKSKSVKIAAILALRNFDLPEVRDFLSTFKSCDDIYLRAAANSALENLRKS